MFASARWVGLLVGLIVVIVAGSVAYKNYQNKLKSTPSTNTTNTNQTVPSSNEQVNNEQTGNNSVASSSALPTVPPSATPKQLDQYVADVRSQAQTSDTLTFTECKSNPQVFKIKTGSSFNIKNNGRSDIQINITLGAMFGKIEPGKTIKVKMEAQPSIYRYNCTSTGGVSVPTIIEVIP